MGANPLPPADPNEHQHWTEPILCEETRARLEHYRSLGWLPPNYKAQNSQGYCSCRTVLVKILYSFGGRLHDVPALVESSYLHDLF